MRDGLLDIPAPRQNNAALGIVPRRVALGDFHAVIRAPDQPFCPVWRAQAVFKRLRPGFGCNGC